LRVTSRGLGDVYKRQDLATRKSLVIGCAIWLKLIYAL
jgi:hypothetical protein